MNKKTKVSAGLLSLIPGLGQILTGRYLRGFVLFFSFVIFIDFILVISPCVWGSEQAKTSCDALIIAAIIIWIYNIIDMVRIIWWRERDALRKKKIPLFNKAFALYLQDNMAETEKNLRSLLKLDRDDSDALFYLGVISFRQRKSGRAHSYFNKALQLDVTQKWQWEISKISES